MSLDLILMVLVVLAVAVEALNFLAKDLLPDLYGEKQLNTSLEKAQGELQQTDKKFTDRHGKLTKLQDEVEAARKAVHEVEEQITRGIEVPPVLVHTAGQPGRGKRFRATLSKELPATPDPVQQLIWEKPNFIDVWASDADAAHDAVAGQYKTPNGYQLGAFAPAPVPVQAGKST